MSLLEVTVRAAAVRFTVRVQPRAARTEVNGVHGTALKVRVSAPPVDGAANEAVIALLATVLNLPRAAVRIVSGLSSRSKIVEIEGVDASAIHRLARGTPS
jgi:uncharacterized protein (TIGR00251 family)